MISRGGHADRASVARPEKTRQGLKHLELQDGRLGPTLVARPEKTRQGLKPLGKTHIRCAPVRLQGLKKPDRD